jgi:phosphinothricin acetyltransferase
MTLKIMAATEKIRMAREGDLPALVSIYNHYIANTHITFDTEAFTEESRRLWLDGFSDTGPYRLYVAEMDGQSVGFAYSDRFHPRDGYDPSVLTSIYLDPDFVGKGIGYRLYAHLIEALQAEADVHRAYAGIALPNPGSIALHERLGFKLAGAFHEVGSKFGKYWDVSWYEKGTRAKWV